MYDYIFYGDVYSSSAIQPQAKKIPRFNPAVEPALMIDGVDYNESQRESFMDDNFGADFCTQKYN
jgi:hypothetical protein